MNENIEELIYSLNFIDNIIYINNQEAKLLIHSPLNNLNRINMLYSDNHKLIQNKKDILQNHHLKHLDDKQIKDLQIRLNKNN